MFLSRQRLDDRRGGAQEIGGKKIGGTQSLVSTLEAREGEHLLDHHREVLRDRAHALEHVELGSESGPIT
jgi:hypothetical protein